MDKNCKLGQLRFDTAQRRAFLRGRQLPLAGKPLAVLEVLLQHAGRPVKRETIQQAVWPESGQVDTSRRLNTAIRALRQALDERAGERGMVETVPGVGYRLVAGRRPLRMGLVAGLAVSVVVGAFVMAVARHRHMAAQTTHTTIVEADALLHQHWNAADATSHLDPWLKTHSDSTEGHALMAWALLAQGNLSDAHTHVMRLVDNQALTPAQQAETGWLLLRLGKPEMARVACGRLPSGQGRLNMLQCRHVAQHALGDIEGARESALQVMDLLGANARARGAVAAVEAAEGYLRYLRWRAREITSESPFQRAQLLAASGQRAAALDALQRALHERDPLLVRLESAVQFSGMRGDARYRAVADAVRDSRGLTNRRL